MFENNFFQEEKILLKNKNNLNFKKTEVSLETDLTFRLFSQLNLDLLFDMRLAFGHVLTEWKDTNKVFSLAAINHRSVFNLESTILGFRRAFWFLSKAITSYRRTSIMFVTGLPKYDNFNEFLQFHSAAMPLLGHGYAMHWIPGILTNFYMLISKFWGRAEIIMPRYTKQLKREWFFESLRGVKLFHTFPNFVCFFSTSGIYEVAIKEALLLKIPTIAFVDSDQEVMNITFPIVGNDDSLFGLEVKIYLFRELLVRSLKKFLFSEIEQLLIEQYDLRQGVFKNYFSDRFSEMLSHEKTQFFLRMKKKTRETIRIEDRKIFRQNRLRFFKMWVSNLHKMSIAFLKKNVFNFGLLKKKYKTELNSVKKLKFCFSETVHCNNLELFFVNLEVSGINFVENSLSGFFYFPKKLKKNTFNLSNFFIFVKKLFVLQMGFNFIYSSRILFTKEQLKLVWLFFIYSKLLKKQTLTLLDLDVSKTFFSFISLFKNLSNFSVYFLQYRLSFFSNLCFDILNKSKHKNFFKNIISEGVLLLDSKFSIKKTKNINVNFFKNFLNSMFSYANLFFSKNFYVKRILQRKKNKLELNNIARLLLKSKKAKTLRVRVKKSKAKGRIVLIKKQKTKKKTVRAFSHINNFLKVTNKNADAFLAKHLISWKLYKLKRRNFFSLEKQLQKQTYSRLVLLKYNTLFSFFPSLRSFFLKSQKRKPLKSSGFFQREIRGRWFRIKDVKLPFLPKKNRPRLWFRFRLKHSLLFYIKKKNLKTWPYKRSWHNTWSIKNFKKYNKQNKNLQAFLYNKRYYYEHKKKRRRLPNFIYKRYYSWLRDKPFLSLVLPKFFVPRYSTSFFYEYTDNEFLSYRSQNLFFVFDFLNYIRYKKKLLLCFLDLKKLVKDVLFQNFKTKLCNLFCLSKNTSLLAMFFALKKPVIHVNFLLMFSKFYNLILMELNVLLKNEMFSLESVHFLILIRFFYYLHKIFKIFSLDKTGLNSSFLQIRFLFFSKLNFNKIYSAFFSKNVIKNFFVFYKKQSKLMKQLFKIVKKQQTRKVFNVFCTKTHKNNLSRFTDSVRKKKIKNMAFSKFLRFVLKEKKKNSKFRRLYFKYVRTMGSFFLRQYSKKNQKFSNTLTKHFFRLNLYRFLFAMYLRYCSLVSRKQNYQKRNNIVSFFSLVNFKRGDSHIRHFPRYTRTPGVSLWLILQKIIYGLKLKAYKGSTLLKKIVPNRSSITKNKISKINSLLNFDSNVLEHLFAIIQRKKKKVILKKFSLVKRCNKKLNKNLGKFYLKLKKRLFLLVARKKKILNNLVNAKLHYIKHFYNIFKYKSSNKKKQTVAVGLFKNSRKTKQHLKNIVPRQTVFLSKSSKNTLKKKQPNLDVVSALNFKSRKFQNNFLKKQLKHLKKPTSKHKNNSFRHINKTRNHNVRYNNFRYNKSKNYKHRSNFFRPNNRYRNNLSKNLNLTPKFIFSLRYLQNLGFFNFFSYILNSFPKKSNQMQNIYKKRPIDTNFLESLFRYKKKFQIYRFFKYRVFNFMLINFRSGKVLSSQQVNTVPRIVSYKPRVNYTLVKNRGFFVKVLSYRLGVYKKQKNIFYKEDNLYKFNRINLPKIIKLKNEKTVSQYRISCKNFHLQKTHNKRLQFVRNRVVKREFVKLTKDEFLKTLNYKINKRRLKLKYKNIGFIFKKFKFYFQKLRAILFNMFTSVKLNSLSIFDKFFAKFGGAEKKIDLNNLVLNILKQSFFIFLYRIFLNLKQIENNFRDDFGTKGGVFVKPRIAAQAHFSYNLYLNTQFMLPKHKVSTLFYLFFKLKKARDFYFLKYSKILGNQQKILSRAFNKKNFRFLKVFY